MSIAGNEPEHSRHGRYNDPNESVRSGLGELQRRWSLAVRIGGSWAFTPNCKQPDPPLDLAAHGTCGTSHDSAQGRSPVNKLAVLDRITFLSCILAVILCCVGIVSAQQGLELLPNLKPLPAD